MEGIIVFDSEFERNLFELRKAKLEEIEKLGQAAYPNQFPASHTVPQVRAKWGEAHGRSAGSQARDGGRGRAHHGHPRAGQGRLCHAAAGRRAAADLRAPGRGGRAGLCALQAARPGRPHRRDGLSVPHPHRRVDRARGAADLPGQGHAGAAGEVSRAGRRGAALPAALCGPVHQPRQPRGLCEARQSAEGAAAVLRRARVPGSGNADDAADRRRRGGAALQDAPQRAGSWICFCALRRSFI